jgi:hypothetical protein
MLQQLGIDLNTIGPHMQVRQSVSKPKRAWQSVRSCDRRATLLTALDDVFNSISNTSSELPIVSSIAATTAAVVAIDDSDLNADQIHNDYVFADAQVACYTGVLNDGVADEVADTVSRRRSQCNVSAVQHYEHTQIVILMQLMY